MRSPLHTLLVPVACLSILAGSCWTAAGQTAAAGRTFRFDGINDYAFATNFGSLMPTGAITIEWWMSAEVYTNQVILALSPDQATNRLAATGPGVAPGGRMGWDHGNTNSGGSLSYLPAVNLSNSWQHFAVVADPAGSGVMRIYRNGVQESGKAGVSPLAPGDYLLQLGGSSTHTQFFRGQLDEVRVWNTARSQAEIQFHRHRPITNTEPGLVAYYRFDEPSGTLVADSSTNALNAVLTNASTVGTRNSSGALLERLSATTHAVTNITASSATFGGMVTTHYWTCGVWFAWGPRGFPTNIVRAFDPTAPPSSTPQARFATVPFLQPGLAYEVSTFVSNGVDLASGLVQYFSTLSLSNAATALPGISNGVSAWGDFDNDGDLDLLLAGQTATNFITAIFRNDGGSFISVFALPPTVALADCSGAWGDVDNDGDLDVLMTGRSATTTRTYLLENLGGTNFSNSLVPGVPGHVAGSLALGDYDNDGDLDALITGDTNMLPTRGYSMIYRNEGGVFTNSGVALRGVFRSDAAWMDYNRDGALDLVLAGQADASPLTNTLVYRSLGPAGFTNAAVLRGTRGSAVAWGDFDRNNAPDLAVAGATNASGTDRSWSGVFALAGGDTFALAAFAPVTVFDGAVAFGDYDNDGGLDLVVAGNDEGPVVSALYRHQTGSTFANSGELLTGMTLSTAAWGDYDGDADLDLLMTGSAFNFGSYSPSLRLYVNRTAKPNTPPGAPSALTSSFRGTNGTAITIGWGRAVDLETTNLTYNVRLGTNSGGIEVISPQSDLTTGRRLLPAPGNFGFNDKSGFVTNLNPFLTYYWSVQAVDGAYAGGPWAPEEAIHYVSAATHPADPITPVTATLQGTVHPYALDTWAWFRWGTNSVNENTTPVQHLGAPLTATNVAAMIALPPHAPLTPIVFRIVASNAVGNVALGVLTQFVTPWLVPSMASISNGLAPGQFNACQLNLTNLTANPATLSIDFEGGTPAWIGVTGPLTLSAGATGAIGLVFNALSLAPGTYSTTLVVAAAGLPAVRIPVNLHVGPEFTAKPGDLNKDGVVDLLELNTVIQYYRGSLP